MLTIVTRGQDTSYFDRNWNKVKTLKTAKYYEVIERDISDTNKVKDLTYFKSGQIRTEKHRIIYKDGNKVEGKLKEWYENGQLYKEIDYKDNKINGNLLIYYKTGKPKRIDSYENDSLISGKCFNSKGKITIHSEYEKAPEFPGGSDKLIEYLEKEVHRSQKSTAGVVILSFYLNENGKVSKIKVIESINEEQDKEAIRVIKKMPKWTPLMVEGRATGCSLTLPVIWTN